MKPAVRPSYGIDAPGVIRTFYILSALFLAAALFFPVIQIGKVRIRIASLAWTGTAVCFVQGSLMALYGKWGKYRHRDRMLGMATLAGNETVLDVGTGRGLLLIGAARRLTTGRAIGIDIWNKEDLSGNSFDEAMANARLENVEDKIEILNQNIIRTDFPDDHLEVILSNLCLHNIPKADDRRKACGEIYRILKQGGTALISDFKNTANYRAEFDRLGMRTERVGTYFLDTFPPLTIIRAVKA